MNNMNKEKLEIFSKEDIDAMVSMVMKFGVNAQTDKIQEEAQELALALHQHKCPTKNKKETLDNVYGELADMKIMMTQAEMIFDSDKINSLVKVKLSKMKSYLNK